MKTKNKISPFGSGPVFWPKIRCRQKKSLYSHLVWFLAQNYVKTKKKSLPRFCPFHEFKLFAQVTKRGPSRNFATILCKLYYPGNPRGGRPWHHAPSPKYTHEYRTCKLKSLVKLGSGARAKTPCLRCTILVIFLFCFFRKIAIFVIF